MSVEILLGAFIAADVGLAVHLIYSWSDEKRELKKIKNV